MKCLHIDSIIKSYGDKTVLSDIYLQCKPGEIIGLLGRNGSGKSTLFQVIFGSINADQQFIRVNDIQLLEGSSRKNLIAFLPQHGLIPNDIKVNTALRLFVKQNLSDFFTQNPLFEAIKNQKTGNLSHGEKRMLEILLVLHSKAHYILLDEPFNGLSPLMKDQVKKHIISHSDKGFIISDHDFHNVNELSSRLILLQDGGIKEINSRQELVERAYLPF